MICIRMRSILKQLNIFSWVSITAIVLIAISFSSYLYIGAQSEQSTSEYREIITLINSSISILHDLEIENKGPEESEQLLAVTNRLAQAIDNSSYQFVYEQTQFRGDNLAHFEGDSAELISCFGKAARLIGERYRSLSEMNVGGSLEEFLPHFKKLVDKNIPCDRLALAFLNPYGDVTAE